MCKIEVISLQNTLEYKFIMEDETIVFESTKSLESSVLHIPDENDSKDCVELTTLKSSNENIITHIEDQSLVRKSSVSQESGYSMLSSFKKLIKQHFKPSKSTSLHKSMTDLSISPKKLILPPTGNQLTNPNSTSRSNSSISVNKSNLTQDVPDDITFIQNEHDQALCNVLSINDEQLLLLQSSWSIVKQHIEKIGVITFLGIFEQHSDFRDAFTEFRKRKFVDVKHDPAMQVHGLRVLSIVDKMITRLPKTDDIELKLMTIGSKHCRYVPTIGLISVSFICFKYYFHFNSSGL
ncbi:Globin X [Schistosoma japonicum]|nr:Globin X [Schistosoma japonicum]